MTPNRSFYRAAILTGVAACLVAFMHVSPAAAQDTTRYMTSCIAGALAGQWSKSCSMSVPAGKVFVIESATVYGGFAEGQRVHVLLKTMFNGIEHAHAVPAGFPMVDQNGWGGWAGAISGRIFAEGGAAEPGLVTLSISRYGSAVGNANFRVTLAGHLEDK